MLHELALDPAVAPDSAPALVTAERHLDRGVSCGTPPRDLAGVAATLVPPGRTHRGGGRQPARRWWPSSWASPPPGASSCRSTCGSPRRRSPTRSPAPGPRRWSAPVTSSTGWGPSCPTGRAAPTTVGLDPGSGDVSLESLVAAPATPGPPPSPQPDDPAWIIATSGTTGRPKGAVLTARSLGAAVASTAVARPLAADDVYLYPFPLYHVSAYNVLHALSRGRPVVLPRRFDAGTVVELAGRHRVTVMSLAPTMLRILLDHLADAARSRRRRWPTCGRSPTAPHPMPAALLAEASAALGVGFAQGYGMTELSGNAVFLGPDDHARGLAGEERLLRAAGWPGPGVELEVVDEDGTGPTAGRAGRGLDPRRAGVRRVLGRPGGDRRGPPRTAGCAPATSARSTTTGSSPSSTGPRTSSSAEGRTWPPGRWRTSSAATPTWRGWRWWGCPTTGGGRPCGRRWSSARDGGPTPDPAELVTWARRAPGRVQGPQAGRARRRPARQRRGQGGQGRAAPPAWPRTAEAPPAVRDRPIGGGPPADLAGGGPAAVLHWPRSQCEPLVP